MEGGGQREREREREREGYRDERMEEAEKASREFFVLIYVCLCSHGTVAATDNTAGKLSHWFSLFLSVCLSVCVSLSSPSYPAFAENWRWMDCLSTLAVRVKQGLTV